jgi:Na+-driven multidrug efflux pump
MKHRKVHEDDNIIEKPVLQAPDIRAIIKFAIPAIGIWLCGPLLSLIDTGAVGILSGTAQLAAFEILGKLWPPEPDPDIGGSGKK